MRDCTSSEAVHNELCRVVEVNREQLENLLTSTIRDLISYLELLSKQGSQSRHIIAGGQSFVEHSRFVFSQGA